MNKKLLTLLGILFVTVLVCTGCKNNLIAEYELPNDTTVRLYEDGKCEYEERYVVTHYSDDYPDFKLMPIQTVTETATHVGTYQKTSDNSYLLNISTIISSTSAEVDHDNVALSKGFESTENSDALYAASMAIGLGMLKDVDGPVILNRSGYSVELDLNDNGQVEKIIVNKPGYEVMMVGSNTEPKEYDEYVFYYDENGDLDHYTSLTNVKLSGEYDIDHNVYNKYGDIIKQAHNDRYRYEYTYYDDGTKKSEEHYFDGILKSKYEYFSDGKLSSVYNVSYEDSKELETLDRETNTITRKVYDKKGNLISHFITEYNEDGTRRTYTVVGENGNTVDNYTYNIKKYLNGELRLYEVFVNDVKVLRNEYNKKGQITATYKYTNGEQISVEINTYKDGVITETKYGKDEESITSVKKYGPISHMVIQSLYRHSIEEEFAISADYTESYNKKTKETTMSVYSHDEDHSDTIIITDKSSNVISIESYEYTDDYMSIYKKQLLKTTGKNTAVLEFYNSQNELIHKLNYRLTKDGLIIDPAPVENQ